MGAIITICSLLLFGYIFDIFSSKIKVPTVILLLLTGWLLHLAIHSLNIRIPDLSDLLSPIGTIGLILIVLEGSLELEINKTKIPVILKTGIGAFSAMFLFTTAITIAIMYFGNTGFRNALLNAIPLSIISSAIAIPSSQAYSARHKEFVIYESSISDIIGVIFFTFVTTYSVFEISIIGSFVFQTLLMLILSLGFSILLVFIMKVVRHKVKFLPIVILVILIYSIAKEFHLPALIFILIFGLFLRNIKKLKRISVFSKFDLVSFEPEINKFNDLVFEMTFLIRVLFFILFGYLISTGDILNVESLYWSLPIVAAIYLIRYLQLKLSRVEVLPLLFMAPRGLITILFFFSIPAMNIIPEINISVITQIILISSFIIMFGSFTRNGKSSTNLNGSKVADFL